MRIDTALVSLKALHTYTGVLRLTVDRAMMGLTWSPCTNKNDKGVISPALAGATKKQESEEDVNQPPSVYAPTQPREAVWSAKK